MKRKSFIPLLTTLTLVLSGCFSIPSVIPGSNEEEPTLTIKETPDVFYYDANQKEYILNIENNKTFQIEYSLGDYTGSNYYVVFNNTQENISISSTGLVTANSSKTSMDFAYFYINLMKKGKSVAVKSNTVWVNIDCVGAIPSEEDEIFTFNAGDMYYDKDYRDSSPWFFNIASGYTFQISPVLLYENGSVTFDLASSAKEKADEHKLTVTSTGLVSVDASSTYTNAVYIYMTFYKNNDFVRIVSIRAFINGTQTGDNMKYPDARIAIDEGQFENVTVKEMSKYYKWDYEFSIPYDHNTYKLPEIKLNGFSGDWTYEYATSSKNNSIFIENDNFFFNTEIVDYHNYIQAITRTKDGEIIDTRIIRIAISHKGRGSVMLYDLNNDKFYNDGDSIELLNNANLILYPMFNQVTKIYNGQTTSSDLSIISVFQGGAALTLTAKNIGKSTVTYTCVKKDWAQVEYEYTVTLNISVINRTLERIYVANPDAIRISGNSVAINSKVYAQYTGEYFEIINNKSTLSYQITDKDDTTKIVSFSYIDGTGQSASVQYEIDTTKEYGYSKTKLSKTYYNMWEDYTISSPTKVEAKFLVIPVWFSNSDDFFNLDIKDVNGKTQKEQVLEDLDTLVFDEGHETSWMSIKQYYEQESNFTLSISGDVADEWCVIDHASTEYLRIDQPGASTTTRQITDLALDWYMKKYNKTFHDFDANNDGIIDNLMIYYGAHYVGRPQTEYEYRQGGRAYVSSISRTMGLDYTRFAFISAFNMYGLKPSSSVVEQSKAISDLSSNRLDASTSIHEVGHLFGLRDLYDTVIDSEIFPAGKGTMQDYEVGGHDPYSLMALGWISPYIFDSSDNTLDNSIEITINDLQSSGDVVLLTPKWNDKDTPFDEYILLDLFTPTGVNERHFKNFEPGVRVWHINAELNVGGYHKYSNNSESVEAGDNLVYNLVHYIRNDVNSAYGRDASTMTQESMFHAGDTFSLEKYQTQFLNKPYLDNGETLGWSVEIVNIVNNGNGTYSTTLRLTK